MPTREEAWELLCEYTKGDSLRKHALAVETAMRACARRYGETDADEDEWALVGLLHDFDYEMFPTPDQHPFTGANILCGRGYSDRLMHPHGPRHLHRCASRHDNGAGPVCDG